MTITEPQAQSLAKLLHEIRPDWITTSLLNLLWQHRDNHELPTLAAAAIAAANNPLNRTPAVIFMDGPHWQQQEARQAPQQFQTAAERKLERGAQLHAKYTAIEIQKQATGQPMATGTQRALVALSLADEFRREEERQVGNRSVSGCNIFDAEIVEQ